MPRFIPHKLALLALLIASCQNISFTPISIPTSIPEQPTSTPLTVDQLPAALYYLSHSDTGIARIFRLAQTGQAPMVIASAPDGSSITDFDVSILSHRLAFIAENRLYLDMSDGTSPITILDGGRVDPNMLLTNHISDPVWSPDGNTLAFAYNGIQLYLADTATLIPVFPNIPADSDQTNAGAMFSPYAWSPDQTHLLVSISLPDKTSLGILNISTASLISLPSICCQAVWQPDSLGVMVANPFTSIGPTGLWVYTLANDSISPFSFPTGPDGISPTIGWPSPTTSEEFSAFYTTAPAPVDGILSFGLINISFSSIVSMVPLRTDQFQIKEILWAPNASLAVAVMPLPAETSWSPAGTIVLIPASEQPGVPLAASGYNLHWGP